MHSNFENVSVHKNGTHFHARCVLCGDSKKNKRKKRFHLEWNNGLVKWHCFNCGKSSKDFSFLKLYQMVTGISFDQAKRDLYRYDSDKLKNRLSKNISEEKNEDTDIYYNDLMHDCISETGHVDSMLAPVWRDCVKSFREERMIPEKYKLFYAYKGYYQGRIIIPVYDGQENIIYFQARRVPGSGIDPKYKNPASLKGLIIHNSEMFDRNKPIIVTEGLIDAFMIGDQGTTALGKEIGEELLKKLFKLTDKYVVLAYDNDDEGQKSLQEFISRRTDYENNFLRRGKLKFFVMPEHLSHCKDINICKVEEGIDDMYRFILENSLSWERIKVKDWMNKKGGGS